MCRETSHKPDLRLRNGENTNRMCTVAIHCLKKGAAVALFPRAAGKLEFCQGPGGLFLPGVTSCFCSLEPIISFGDSLEIIQIASEVTARRNLRSQQIKPPCRLTSCLGGIPCRRIEPPRPPLPGLQIAAEHPGCVCLLKLRPLRSQILPALSRQLSTFPVA